MTDERPAIRISPNDNEALEQIIEQYKDGGCDRNDVIAALFGSIASICSLQNLSTDYSLLLSSLETRVVEMAQHCVTISKPIVLSSRIALRHKWHG
jgi:hypothetical protein